MNEMPPPLEASVLDAFRSRLRGTICIPGDAHYDTARRVWNGAINRRPSCVIGCADAEDVSHAVRIASDNGLPITIRGGGHNVAGRSIRDGAPLLDLSRLRNVSVNRELHIATVQGGATWRDVDGATAIDGLATTGGLVSSTGVGGFTLGGGAGWLMRKHGLACDNSARSGHGAGRRPLYSRLGARTFRSLLGPTRRGRGASASSRASNFSCTPCARSWPGSSCTRRNMPSGRCARSGISRPTPPTNFAGIAVIAHGPPLPFIDPAWHGRPVVMFAICWSGALGEGEKALAALRAYGRPIVDHVAPMAYTAWQQLQDPAAARGHYYYWKTANYEALSDSTLGELAAMADHLPTMRSEIHVQHMGGAIVRLPSEESAFPHRNARYFVNFIGITDTADAVDRLRERIRTLYKSASADALPGVLTNFADQDDSDTQKRFGLSAGRLEGLKRKYDPAGILLGS